MTTITDTLRRLMRNSTDTFINRIADAEDSQIVEIGLLMRKAGIAHTVRPAAYVVTTTTGDTFFGYTDHPDASNIRLTAARRCTNDPFKIHGSFSLATEGPSSSTFVSPPVDITILNVALIIPVTATAVQEWERV